MAFLAPVLVEFTKGFQTDMKTMSVIMSVGRAIGLVTSLGCKRELRTFKWQRLINGAKNYLII